MTIHQGDPFLVPEGERSPLRRLRARLVAPVTLWTSGPPSEWAGLTVASVLVAEGEPGRVVGLLDPESELWAAVQASGRMVVTPLQSEQRNLADAFAGAAPAPGGPFQLAGWRQTEWGPLLDGATTWCGCRLQSARDVGFAALVDATVEHVEVGADLTPLARYRGRYDRLQGHRAARDAEAD